MMGADTGLHADQAGRHVGQPCLHLATRPLLPQRDSATPIEADDVKPVLADIDTDRGDHTLLCFPDMACSFRLVPPASLRADRGQEHGRTSPLADIGLPFVFLEPLRRHSRDLPGDRV